MRMRCLCAVGFAIVQMTEWVIDFSRIQEKLIALCTALFGVLVVGTA